MNLGLTIQLDQSSGLAGLEPSTETYPGWLGKQGGEGQGSGKAKVGE